MDAQPGPVEVRFTSDARIALRTSGRAVTSPRRPSWRYCARLSGGLVDRTRDFAGRHLQTITRLKFTGVAAVLADDKAVLSHRSRECRLRSAPCPLGTWCRAADRRRSLHAFAEFD